MCKSGTQTATTSSAPNPQAMAAYDSLLGTAANVAATPYTPYNAPLVAPVNAQQYQGIAGINNNASFAQPYIDSAAGLALTGASPITTAQINQYASPYTQAVVDATQAQFNNQNAQQMEAVKGNAISQGALGGNREAIAEAETANQQNLAQAPVIAGLENQGYTTGLNTALTEQQAAAQGAYSMGNLGVAGQNAALTGANAQVGAGTLEQQTQQALYSAAYQQFLNQLAYPFQTTQWLAGIDTGVGSQMGGTSETTQPGPNQGAQDAGLGIAGIGALGQLGGSAGLAGLLALSDRRAKENLKKIGKLFDGQTIYRFNYKGDTATRIGLVAQDVEHVHPEAVHEFRGLKHVDYDEATKDAIRRSFGGGVGYAGGGGVANRHPTIPETHDTMVAQQHQLMRGHRRAQMFPHGTKELPLPKGMQRVESGGGVFHFNPRHLSAKDIHHHSAAQTENHLLDLGPFSKGEILHRVAGGEIPLAVVERDPHGTEVRAALGTHVTAPHQFEALHRTKSPGHTIHIEDVRSTLGRRMQGGRVQGLDTGGVAYSTFGGGYGTPQTPYTGGTGYVPTMGITRGQGAPPPPRMAQQPDYAGDAMKAVSGMAKQLGVNTTPASGGKGPGNGVAPPDLSSMPGKGGIGDQGFVPDPSSLTFDTGSSGSALYRRGGAVHPLIGVANHNSIRMPQNYYSGGVVHRFADGGGDDPFAAPAGYQSNVGGDEVPLVPAQSNGVAPTIVAPGVSIDATSGGDTDTVPLPRPRPNGIDPGTPISLTPDITATTNAGVAPAVPRGIRNNNPGNIEDGGFARNQPGYAGSDGRFARFDTPASGTNAAGNLIRSYGGSGVNTLSGIISRWAPSSDNDTGAYVSAVSNMTGIGPDEKIDMSDPNVRSKIVGAISRYENGNYAGSDQGGIMPSHAQLTQGIAPPTGGGVDFSSSGKLWPALMAMGFGMAASRNPHFAGAMGEGGLQGMRQYGAEQEQEMSQNKIKLEAQKLSQELEMERAKLAAETGYHKGELSLRSAQVEQGNWKVVSDAFGRPMWLYNSRTNETKPFNAGTPATRNQSPSGISLINPSPIATQSPGFAVGGGTSNDVTDADADPGPDVPNITPAEAAVAAPDVALPAIVPDNSVKVAQNDLPVPGVTAVDAPHIQMVKTVPNTNPSLSTTPTAPAGGGDLSSDEIPKVGRLPAAAENTAKMIANYELPPLAGFVMKTPYGQQVMGRVSELNDAYNAQNYGMSQRAYTAFATGKQGDQTRFFNNAVQHMNTLQQYALAMNNGDYQKINALKNWIQTQTGTTAPNTFDGLKDIVGMEVVKSIVPGGGGEREREEVAKHLAAVNSYPQLISLLQGYKELGGAQLRDLGLQYEQSTFRKDYDRWLTPESKEVYEAVKSGGHALSPMDHAALDWANANPKDPRSEQIKARLGVK